MTLSDSWKIRKRRTLSLSSTNDDYTHTSSNALPIDDAIYYPSDSDYPSDEYRFIMRCETVAVKDQAFEELGREVNIDCLSELEASKAHFK